MLWHIDWSSSLSFSASGFRKCSLNGWNLFLTTSWVVSLRRALLIFIVLSWKVSIMFSIWTFNSFTVISRHLARVMDLFNSFNSWFLFLVPCFGCVLYKLLYLPLHSERVNSIVLVDELGISRRKGHMLLVSWHFLTSIDWKWVYFLSSIVFTVSLVIIFWIRLVLIFWIQIGGFGQRLFTEVNSVVPWSDSSWFTWCPATSTDHAFIHGMIVKLLWWRIEALG